MFCAGLLRKKKKKNLKIHWGKKQHNVILIIFVYLQGAFFTSFESVSDFGEEIVN